MRKTFTWEIPTADDGSMAVNDPLLSCLVMLTKYYKSPSSARTLTANLPLKDGKLTPALFSEAAERAKFETQLLQSSLYKIKNATLPAVLLLADGTACLLVEKNDEYARILLMETGGGLNSVKLAELEQMYGGYTIYVKPFYNFSQRSQDTLQKQDKHWLLRSMFKAWPLYIEILFGSALVNLFAIAMPLFVMNVYDRVVPNQAIETLWVLASGVAIVFLFDFLLKSMRSYFIDAAGKRIDVELSSKIFSKILGIQLSARPRSVGALANTVQSFEVFRDFITSTTITILVDIPFVFLFIFIISLIGGDIYMLPLTMLPIVIVIGLLLQWPLIKLTRQSYQYSAEKQATLIESLGGIETIKTCGAEGSQQQRWESVVTRSAKLGSKLRFISTLSVNFTLICQQLVSVSVVIYGVYKITAGDLTMGALIACTILSGRAIAPIAQLAGLFTRYFQSVNALKSINKVMQMPTDIVDQKSYLHRPNLDGSIEFKDVCFFYEKENLQILNNLSFKVGVGERVGIIGTIGTGKTTIAKLMLGLYSASKGTILIGGVDQNQINPADLRNQIGYVPQDVVLFYGTIKENISFGAAHMDDASILKASKIAGVDHFVKNHPDGYDMQVGERGKNISQGQRQAVAIARSLLLSPTLMVLDEPCASMDIKTETAICNYLKNNVPKATTMIVITHKPSILRLVDRLMVLDGGKLVMDGPRDQVLEKLHGKTAEKVNYKPNLNPNTNANSKSKVPVPINNATQKQKTKLSGSEIKQQVQASLKNEAAAMFKPKSATMLAKQIIDSAKLEANKIKIEQVNAAKLKIKELEDAQTIKSAQFKDNEKKVTQQIEKRRNEIDIESSKLIKSAQKQANNIIKKAESNIEKLKTDSEYNNIEDAKTKAAEIINKAESKAKSIRHSELEAAKAESLLLLNNAEKEINKVKQEQLNQAEKQIVKTIEKEESEKVSLEAAKTKANEIINKAESKAKRIREYEIGVAKIKADEIINKAESKAKRIRKSEIDASKEESLLILSKAEKEMKEMKQDQLNQAEIQAAKIIKKAQSENISIEEAKVKASEIINKAESQANMIKESKIKDAQEESLLILSNAEKEINKIQIEKLKIAEEQSTQIINNAKSKVNVLEIAKVAADKYLLKSKNEAVFIKNNEIKLAKEKAQVIIDDAKQLASNSELNTINKAQEKAAQIIKNAKSETKEIINKEIQMVRDAEKQLHKLEEQLIKETKSITHIDNPPVISEKSNKNEADNKTVNVSESKLKNSKSQTTNIRMVAEQELENAIKLMEIKAAELKNAKELAKKELIEADRVNKGQ